MEWRLLENYSSQIYIHLKKSFTVKLKKIAIMDELPINWTYPEIQPKLIEEAKKRGFCPQIRYQVIMSERVN